MDPHNHINIRELQAEISQTRKNLLDLLEMAFGDHPKWPYARSRVLRSLGRSGIEGILERMIEEEKARGKHA